MTDRPQHTPGPWSFSPQDGGKNHCNVAQVWDANGNSLAIIETTDDPAIASANAALIARAPELLARVEELESECAGWRQEGVALRRLVRDYEPDKERMDAYRRDLEEIGKTIGCDHIDDGLQRCVESTIDDLAADNARLQSERDRMRELLQRWADYFGSSNDEVVGALLRTSKAAIGEGE